MDDPKLRVMMEQLQLQWVHGPQTVVMFRSRHYYVSCTDASMGPRSSDRGYAYLGDSFHASPSRLQWVHGPQTVVMNYKNPSSLPNDMLQWVHGPQTVVMNDQETINDEVIELQWVHGPQTVVMFQPLIFFNFIN